MINGDRDITGGSRILATPAAGVNDGPSSRLQDGTQ